MKKENQELTNQNLILAKKLEDFEVWHKNIQQSAEAHKQELQQSHKLQQDLK